MNGQKEISKETRDFADLRNSEHWGPLVRWLERGTGVNAKSGSAPDPFSSKHGNYDPTKSAYCAGRASVGVALHAFAESARRACSGSEG